MVKEQEVIKIDEEWKGRRFSGKAFVILLFILIAISLLGYAFYDQFPEITGRVIGIVGDKNETEVKTFQIRTELSELDSYLEINNQDIEKIFIELGKSDASLFFGSDGALNLSNLERTKIEIEGFRGVIVFDKDRIYNLNGNVFRLTLNDIPASSQNSEMKIAINKELNYESLELDSIYIKKYESISDKGRVIIDKDRLNLNLNDESFSLQEFFGKLESGTVGNFGIMKQGLILDGTARGINVGGKFKIDFKS